MNKKYIVQSCPSLDTDGITCQDCSFEDCGMEDCSNRSNCLIKQVIKKCRKKKEWFSKLPDGVAFDLTTFLGGNLQDEILQLFEIEECNDDKNYKN